MASEDRNKRSVEANELLVPANVEGGQTPYLLDRGRPLVAQRPMAEREHLVRDVLESLSEDDQRLAYAYFYERLSYREMAARFGWGGHETPRRRLQALLLRIAAELPPGVLALTDEMEEEE